MWNSFIRGEQKDYNEKIENKDSFNNDCHDGLSHKHRHEHSHDHNHLLSNSHD
jgi:hypothetical protein